MHRVRAQIQRVNRDRMTAFSNFDKIMGSNDSLGHSNPPDKDCLTVFQVNTIIRELMADSPVLSNLVVQGEISNFVRASSGHLYFSLKDDRAAIRCVMFRGNASRITFQPSDGDSVVARGQVNVFEKRGEYQLYCNSMAPAGMGEMYAAFMELKVRLEKEGLFDPSIKKSIPPFPRKIGVVTSLTGAAARDFFNVARRRDPGVNIVFANALVQGDQAPVSIATAIDSLGTVEEVDLLVVTRGGGSFEELMAFNTEIVARAIARCNKPIIAAIGHETDFSIAEFVADLRAPTPSAAAELVTRDTGDLIRRVLDQRRRLHFAVNSILRDRASRLSRADFRRIGDNLRLWIGQAGENIDVLSSRMERGMNYKIKYSTHALERLSGRLKGVTPYPLLADMGHRFATLHRSLLIAQKRFMENRENRLLQADAHLSGLSPRAVLNRGFAWLEKPLFSVPLRSVREVDQGEIVRARLVDGSLLCHVERVEPDTKKGKGEKNG